MPRRVVVKTIVLVDVCGRCVFLSTSFGIETGKYVQTLRPTSFLENRTRFQMGKVYTCFQTKRAQKPFPLGRHIHNYMAYIREYLPPPPSPRISSVCE